MNTSMQFATIMTRRTPMIVDVSGAIIDIYKLQIEAIKSFTYKDDIARHGAMMADMGIVEDNNVKMLDI